MILLILQKENTTYFLKLLNSFMREGLKKGKSLLSTFCDFVL